MQTLHFQTIKDVHQKWALSPPVKTKRMQEVPVQGFEVIIQIQAWA